MALKMDGLLVKARPIRDRGNTSCDDRFQNQNKRSDAVLILATTD